MRLLAVLYCYPPLLVPASICYLKLILGLRNRGVDVDLVTITPESFVAPGENMIDPTLESVIPEGVTNFRILSPESWTVVNLLKQVDPGNRWTYRFLQPRKREWTFPAIRFLKTLDLSRYDAILTCSQPHANHLIGMELKKTTGLPWVAYFSDPWSRNPYASYASATVADYNRKLEKQVLEAADRVLFTSPEMLDLVVEGDPAVQAKSGVIPHAFVPDWYEEPGTGTPDSVLRILHTGHFYGPRNPGPVIRALAGLARERSLEGRIQIDTYGSMDARYRTEMKEAGVADWIQVQGVIPYLESLRLMRQYDLLLLVDAALTDTTASVFLPSKLVDYLGAGKPILAITPRRGATARVVGEAGGFLCDIEDEAGIQSLLGRLLEEGVGAGTPRDEAVARYDYRQVGQAMKDEIRKTLPRRS